MEKKIITISDDSISDDSFDENEKKQLIWNLNEINVITPVENILDNITSGKKFASSSIDDTSSSDDETSDHHCKIESNPKVGPFGLLLKSNCNQSETQRISNSSSSRTSNDWENCRASPSSVES